MPETSIIIRPATRVMIETESTVELELPLPGAGAGATSFAPWNVVGAPAVVDG